MSQLELVEAFTSGGMSRRRFIRGLTRLGMGAAVAATYAASLERQPEKAFGAEAFVGYRCVVGTNVTYVATSAEATALAPYLCTELFTTVSDSSTGRTPQVVTPVTAPPTTTTVPGVPTTAAAGQPGAVSDANAANKPRVPAAGLPATL
jgi:hypothetical protein